MSRFIFGLDGLDVVILCARGGEVGNRCLEGTLLKLRRMSE